MARMGVRAGVSSAIDHKFSSITAAHNNNNNNNNNMSDEFKIVNIVGGSEAMIADADDEADDAYDERTDDYGGGSEEDETLRYFEEGGSRSGRSGKGKSGRLGKSAGVSPSPVLEVPAANAVIAAPNNAVIPVIAAAAVGAAPAVIATPATITAPVADVGDADEDSESRCSSDMNTASLIANGCTYTILEQMLMTEGDDGEKRNVAFMLERCAKALEGILGHLVSKPS